MAGGTGGVVQVSKVNGLYLLGLTNRGLVERLISEGLEVEGTLLKAFPFRKRAERITVGNLPFFVADSVIINALSTFGRVTSIAPKLMKAGPYIYNDGRREAFIALHEGVTIERLPTRLEIKIKGETWPAYLTSGIRCSRCHCQGHRRAICPLLAGLAKNTRMAPPTTPAGVPPPSTPAPPQRSAAQPPAPASSDPALETPGAPPEARAVTTSTAPRPSPPVAPAVPMEEAPSAPPPVTPAPSLQAPEGPVGPRPANSQHPEPPPARPDFVAPRGPLPAQKTLGPAAPTPDVEMSIVEETSASSTSTAKNATRVDLDEFIERHPTVSFARTDALGLGREEVLDLLSSRTKAQRKGPLLPPPQCDALAGLIGQILDLRPGAASNLYKVLGQVKAELRTTPTAVPPTPPLPAPQPAGTTPPAPPDEESTLLMQEETMIVEIFSKLKHTTCLRPLYQSGIHFSELMDSVLCHDDRMALMAKLSPALKIVLAEFLGAAIEQAQDCHPNAMIIMVVSDSFYCKYTTCLHMVQAMIIMVGSKRLSFPVSTPHVYTRPCGHASRELLSFSPLESGKLSLQATNLVWADSPFNADELPARYGLISQTTAELSAENYLQLQNSKEIQEMARYANLPTGEKHANSDTLHESASTMPSSGANLGQLNREDILLDQNHEIGDGYTVIQNKRRRRDTGASGVKVAQFNSAGSAARRQRSAPALIPRVQEIRTTRTHIAEARARQATCTEEQCFFLEYCPDYEPYHYLKAIEGLVGGTKNIVQFSKVNGQYLVGLTSRSLAERLIQEGLEVEGTLLRTFPFRRTSIRITIRNLPFFVRDAVVIDALARYGRVTSITPKQLKVGEFDFTAGRREAFILLHDGMTVERLPSRFEIKIKGEAWPAYLTHGIKCSRCHGKGHRRANCPLLHGQSTTSRRASPPSTTNLPPSTAPGLPGPSPAAPTPPAPTSPAVRLSGAQPDARATSPPSTAPRPTTPAPPASSVQVAAPVPPSVASAPVDPASPRSAATEPTPPARPDFIAPCGLLPAQRTLGPAAPTPDVEMSIVEETSASSTSSAKNATRVDLDAFIEKHPSVSFAGTDALGLGREEVLDLLSSRTKAQRKGPLLSPLQCDALAGLIGQILDLRPGAASNLYKVLGQVKAELRTTPAVPPTPTLPAPWPAKPTPPALHEEKTSPDIATPPPPLSTEFIDACYDQASDIIYELSRERYSEPLSDIGVTEGDIVEAIIFPGDREPLFRRLSTQKRTILTEIIGAAIERARNSDPFLATNLVWAGSPSKAEQGPVRHGLKAQPCAEISANQDLQNKSPIVLTKNQHYANLPAGSQDANSAAPVDLSLAAIPTSNAAAQVRRNWADITEEVNPGAEEGFTLVQGRKRRRGSADSPTAAAPSSNPGGSRTIRRPQPSARSVPRAQEIPTTRAHIAEARARQASSAEEHCVYLEHGPELQPFHYLRALDRLLGGTAGVVQVSKVNGHQLLGLANRGLAERLINNGLEVEGTLLRAFPFRKRAERITVGNLPFFVEDSAIIKALGPYERITSIAPKMMKAGPYTYTDGRREAFIVLHEGVTTERLPTRLNITIKGEAWPAYLSSGIKCSRCHGKGHRRANCPLLAGRTTAPGPATPTSPTSVPPATASRLPQQPSAQPPPPASPSQTMEVSDVPRTSRAALHPPAALRQSPPAPSALPAEDAPPAPPPVTPAPSLRTPGSREPAAQTPDVEMSIAEETSASSTSSAKNATRVDLDAFIEKHPSVSFAGTDALGLGREEVLDLLSSRTKAQRKGPLLSPLQCDALAGLIGQILDLRPGAASNLYKVLGQVKAELRTTPAVPPTPTLPAPWPAKPTPPALHGEKTSPDIATPPPPLSTEFIDACYDQANDIIYELSRERYSEPLSDIGVTEGDIVEAIIFPGDREPLFRRLSTQKRTILTEIIGAAIERARNSDPF
ncbi:hypothetical protein LAZ67_8002556, partial [Cordylochernes scorpioides]